jgi:D-lactate dehydrogenase (cytochrome)
MKIIKDRDGIVGALGRGDASKSITPDPNAVEAILFPTTADELSGILSGSEYEHNPRRISGGRTGLTGGCVPQLGQDGNKEVLIRLDDLLAIPTIPGYKTKTAERVGDGKRTITYATDGEFFVLPSGANLYDRTEILRREGRMFPIHPTAQDATIGGTVTTNATGLEGAFGSTRDWTESVGIYLSHGRFIHLARSGDKSPTPEIVILQLQDGTSLKLDLPTYTWNENVKNASGIYTGEGHQPLDLFIGHDGALGICAYAGFRTLPKRVTSLDVFAGMLFFRSHQDAFAYILQAEAAYGLDDGTTITDLKGQGRGIVGIDWIGAAGVEIRKLASSGNKLRVPKKATVALEIGFLMGDDETFRNLYSLAHEIGAIGEGWFFPAGIKAIRNFRHSIPERTNDAVYKKVGSDCAVPLDRMNEMHEFWLEQLDEYGSHCREIGFEGIDKRFGVEIGHPFKGHMHYNVLNTKATYQEARKVQGRIIQKAIELGGVPSGEHGIGAKTAYVDVGCQYRDVPLLELLHGEKALHEVHALRVQLGTENLNRGVLTPIDYS